MTLEFNEEKHEYRLNGVVLPSVTQIIKPLYSYDGISSAILEYAAGRGRAVHKAVELWSQNTLDDTTIDPVIVPYLEAWKKFALEKCFIVTASEQHLAHPHMKYAGTPDAEGLINKEEWLVDIKAVAELHASVGVQLAAYAALIGKPSIRRAAVQLKPDGKYIFQEYKNKSDWPVFVSCLTVHNFRSNNHVN